MKKFLLVFLLILTFCGCGNKETKIMNIDCKELKKILEDGAILLDVRSASEYDSYHLENALNIEYTKIQDLVPGIIPSKDTKIIVYCQSGKRSKIAASSLKELGYKNIYDLGSIENCEK